MKILLIEDQKKVSRFISRGLKEQKYTVDAAYNGEEGQHMGQHSNYDLIILDLMLPDKDGIDVCKTIRQKNKDVPILMLTARETVSDKIKGLDAGADDYLVKPFAFDELLARVRSLTRRGQHVKSKEELKVGEVGLDLLQHKCFVGKQEIQLSSMEYKLLEYFVRHPGEVVTRTALYEQVWGIDFSTDTNLSDVYVNRLRNKINNPAYFHAVRGSGYVFYPAKNKIK